MQWDGYMHSVFLNVGHISDFGLRINLILTTITNFLFKFTCILIYRKNSCGLLRHMIKTVLTFMWSCYAGIMTSWMLLKENCQLQKIRLVWRTLTAIVYQM